MSGTTSNLFQLWQIPSRKFFFRTSSKFGQGIQSISSPNFYPIVCSCREIQTSAYEVVTTGSYIPRPKSESTSKVEETSTVKFENVGAFQKLPIVMPSIDILSSALRKAKRVPPTKGIANIAKRERNRGAKQLDALMKELAVPLRTYTSDFPNKRCLHPYERSLVELTLGEGKYEEVLRKVDGLRKKFVSAGKEHASLCAKSSTKKEAEECLNEGLRRIEEIFNHEKKVLDDLLDITKTLQAMPVVHLETLNSN